MQCLPIQPCYLLQEACDPAPLDAGFEEEPEQLYHEEPNVAEDPVPIDICDTLPDEDHELETAALDTSQKNLETFVISDDERQEDSQPFFDKTSLPHVLRRIQHLRQGSFLTLKPLGHVKQHQSRRSCMEQGAKWSPSNCPRSSSSSSVGLGLNVCIFKPLVTFHVTNPEVP